MKDAQQEHRNGLPLRKAFHAIIVFYIIALALNIAEMHAAIERQPFGPARTFWLTITTPIASGARTLRLDQPRAYLRRQLGAKINTP
jgi:hypothetical protein